MSDVSVLQRLTMILAWREGLDLSRALMCLGRRSRPFDQVLPSRSRREASSGVADINPGHIVIIAPINIVNTYIVTRKSVNYLLSTINRI